MLANHLRARVRLAHGISGKNSLIKLSRNFNRLAHFQPKKYKRMTAIKNVIFDAFKSEKK